jgi:hypothetical protein
MTKKSSAAATLALLLLVLGGTAHATEVVSVGRVDIQLPGEGWQSYAVPDQGNAMSGTGETYQQQTETRVMLRRSSDQIIDAVFIVRANASAKGPFSDIMYPDARCKGPAGTFAEGDPPGPAATSFRCLVITPAGSWADPDLFFQKILGPLAEKGWKVAPSMRMMRATQHASTGAFADVTALIASKALPALSAASEPSEEPLPAGVTATSVQWGRLLQKAVTDSVYSIRGKLPVPELLPSGAPARSN